MAVLGSPVFLLALISCLAIAESAPSNRILTWNSVKNLVAFGDSYTYVQGSRGYTNYSFIGDLQNLAFTPEELLTDYIVQNLTGTAEGGPNYVEYLTGCGLKPGYTLPRSCEPQLWDFAFAGSDVSVDFTPLHHNFTVSFVNQIKQYVDYGHEVVSDHGDPKVLDSTLVSVWIGINDVSDSGNYNVSFPALYANITSTIFKSLESLYDLGYYQYVVFTLPPLDKTPGNVFSSNPVPSGAQVAEWNSALNSSVHVFTGSHEKATVRVFDAHSVLQGFLDNPSKYRIKNATSYCQSYDQPYIIKDPAMYGCLPLDEYFWFNTGHMTSHTHKLMTEPLKSFLERPLLYGP